MSTIAALLERPARRRRSPLIPGAVLAAFVSLLAVAGGWVETRAVGRAIIEPIVLAILIGMVVRAARGQSAREAPGVRFVAKDLLEVAVCLLGATMDVPRLFASGPALALGIGALVCVALGCGYAIGRFAGLSRRLAVLVACGNAICGNSAIAAVAPVIEADHDDVAASIALTAVLGVAAVLGLPMLIGPLGLSNYQYGVLAGLSVYAVPQVLAASFAVSTLSGQVATVVKLARVLMLGPVVLFFSVRRGRTQAGADDGSRLPLSRALPWFVIGFVALAALRSLGLVPDAASNLAKVVAGWLMIASMAGLGLAADVRSVKRVGPRVAIAVGGSLAALLVLSVSLIRVLGLT